MWILTLLLAFMASSSACPDLCQCYPLVETVQVTCTGKIPTPRQLPLSIRKLKFNSAEEMEVRSFLDSFDNSTMGLSNLEELVLTNCSLGMLNVTWSGLDQVRELNLSHNKFVQVRDVGASEAQWLCNVTVLDLSSNQIGDIGDEELRTFPALTWLRISNNGLWNVTEDAFSGLSVLEVLDLSDNKLATLPDNALTPLEFLQKLDLSGNQLRVLGARWFESLGRLRELDVSRNGISRAASGVLQPLPGLSILRLSENPLRERDVSLLLGTGRRLETVDASHTGLVRVPAALTRSVRALRLAGNKLTSIRGGDLDSYPLLRLLDLSDNRLTEVEDDALGRLEVLEVLNLSGNLLATVPHSLPSSLTELHLERNAISALRFGDLDGLYNLRNLKINDNAIDSIEEGSFSQLPTLEQLSVSNNPIKALPANTFSGLTNLAKLQMSGLGSLNREQQEQRDMAFPVPTPERLTTLDLSHSPVLAAQLLSDDATLSACKSLTELNLAYIDVTDIQSDLVYDLPQLRKLGLSGNDWNCSTELYWLGEWIRQHAEMGETARCTEPLHLAGYHLSQMPTPPASITEIPPTVKHSDTIPITMESYSRINSFHTLSSIDPVHTESLIDRTTSFIDRTTSFDPSRTKSITDPSRTTSLIDPSITKSFTDPSRTSFIVPSRTKSLIDSRTQTVNQSEFVNGSPSTQTVNDSLQTRFVNGSTSAEFLNGNSNTEILNSSTEFLNGSAEFLNRTSNTEFLNGTSRTEFLNGSSRTGYSNGSSQSLNSSLLIGNSGSQFSLYKQFPIDANNSVYNRPPTQSFRLPTVSPHYPNVSALSTASFHKQSPTASSGNKSPTISFDNNSRTISSVTASGNQSATASSGNQSASASSGNQSTGASSGNQSATVSSDNQSAVYKSPKRFSVNEHGNDYSATEESLSGSLWTQSTLTVESTVMKAVTQIPRDRNNNRVGGYNGRLKAKKQKNGKRYMGSMRLTKEDVKTSNKVEGMVRISEPGSRSSKEDNHREKDSQDGEPKDSDRKENGEVRDSDPKDRKEDSELKDRSEPKDRKQNSEPKDRKQDSEPKDRKQDSELKDSELKDKQKVGGSKEDTGRLRKSLANEVSNTVAQELSGQVTDSGARVSEALSAGAHPGMLVLVGAALGAAAALTVVLSRRAPIRRRDQYQRQENIEVHSLTSTIERW